MDEAGETRFMAWASNHRKIITELGAGQALYQGIMVALGYSKNKETMRELARRVPLQQLEALASQEISDEEYLAQCQARLLGTAGLLPSQRTGQHPRDKMIEDWEEKLENIWLASSTTACMSTDDWHFFKVRPGNYPVRRIAAMSLLLRRYRQKGMIAGLAEKFIEAADSSEVSLLEQALMVYPDDYWGRYLDFGFPSSGAAPALLGKERAADIIVNVVLPFFFIRRPTEDGEKALNIYHDYRGLEENSLIKHMRQQLGITRYLTNTARRQQGLIHIYQSFCLEGGCGKCPLGKP